MNFSYFVNMPGLAAADLRLCGKHACGLITGSIARSANLPVFSLLRGPIMRVFAPQGRHVAPMGVKFGMEEGTEGL